MQVEELMRFLAWTESELRKKNIEQIFQNFINILQTNLQRNNQRQPFETQQHELQKCLQSVNFSSLNKSQKDFSDQIGFAGVIGDEASATIDDIFQKNAIDIATVHAKIVKMQQQFSSALQNAGAMQAALIKHFPLGEDPDYSEAMVHVRFQGLASISNISELKDWSDKWYIISQGLARATDSTPESIRVVGASKGSIILDFATTYRIAHILNRIIHELYSALILHYTLKKLAAEARKTELEIVALEMASAGDVLEQKAELALSAAQEKVLKSIENNLQLTPEKVAFLKKSIEYIYQFKDGGGLIDTVVKPLPPAEGGDSANPQYQKVAEIIDTILKDSNETMQLEHQVLLLKQGTESDPEGK